MVNSGRIRIAGTEKPFGNQTEKPFGNHRSVWYYSIGSAFADLLITEGAPAHIPGQYDPERETRKALHGEPLLSACFRCDIKLIKFTEDKTMTDENKVLDEEIKEEIDEEADYITLEFDDGTEIEAEIMGVFEVDGKEYIALIPDDDSDDVYLYGYKEVSDEEFELIDIEDDAEFEKVSKEFSKITEEE